MVLNSALGVLGGNREAKLEQAVIPTALFSQAFAYAVNGEILTTTIKRLYSLALWELEEGRVLPIDDLDTHNGTDGTSKAVKAEFFFTVPPKIHEVGEPYATRIVPTQNGGKYVESHGVLIREIRLQGTTGLRPNKPLSPGTAFASRLGPLAGPANSLVGPIINRGDRLVETATGLADSAVELFTGNASQDRDLRDKSERTGWDDMMFLRNIFRRYSDIQKSNENSSNVVMVWRNAKDSEYWVVEPKEFKLLQSSTSPLTYQYVITLSTISRLDLTVDMGEDPLQSIRAGQKFLSRLQKANKEIVNTFSVVSTQLNRLESAGIFAKNLLSTSYKNVLDANKAVISTANNFKPALVGAWQSLKAEQERAYHIASAKFASTTIDPTQPIGSVSPITAPGSADDIIFWSDSSNSFLKALRAATRVLTEPSLHNSVQNQTDDRRNRALGSYRSGIVSGTVAGTGPDTGGSRGFLGNQSYGGALSRAEIWTNDDIKSLAKRLLGSRDQWHILVIINDLRAPYISSAGGDGVLRPGDFILYPSKERGGVSASNLNETDLEKDQKGQNIDTAVERAYGRDLRLSLNSKNKSDIFISEGDFGTIVGIPNVKQGIRLKLATEQGELTVHPKYGLRVPIGTKAETSSFNEFIINVHATLASDVRIKSVKSLDLLSRGDIVSVAAELILRDVADPVSVAAAIRSL